MADKVVKIPGPDHPISIEANPSRVVVTVGGKIVADTRNALTLREASYPAVQYIPRRDVDMTALTRRQGAARRNFASIRLRRKRHLCPFATGLPNPFPRCRVISQRAKE